MVRPACGGFRRVRDAYAARFNYDLRAIFRDLKEQEKRSGRTLVSYAQDAGEFVPNVALQPNAPVPAVSENMPSQ